MSTPTNRVKKFEDPTLSGLVTYEDLRLFAIQMREMLAAIVADGGGNVVGPVSSINGNLASFNGSTGKLIGDEGISANDIVVAAVNLTLTKDGGTVGAVDQIQEFTNGVRTGAVESTGAMEITSAETLNFDPAGNLLINGVSGYTGNPDTTIPKIFTIVKGIITNVA